MTHKLYVKLNQTFITPFDREDIHELASRLDDILDFVNGASDRLLTYKIDDPPAAAAEVAAVIVRQAEELAKAVSMLGKHDGILPHCVEINRLENMADTIARGAIGKIFEEETRSCSPDQAEGIDGSAGDSDRQSRRRRQCAGNRRTETCLRQVSADD